MLIQIPQVKVKQFQSKILNWYSQNKRDLPWRQMRDPYNILISEVMLQQTQVSRVIPKYTLWLQAFPTIEDLAKAKMTDVLRQWSGLGYNRRALYLQKTARAIVSHHNGKWPRTIEELKKLPGIGEYTARAIACFAFNRQVAVVDTNVRKVILTQLCQNQHSEKEIQVIADSLLPKKRAYDWNQALMDYAGAVLKTVKPKGGAVLYPQSKFIGSNRYYRGKLLRLLLEKPALPTPGVGKLLKDDFSSNDTEWLSDLLKGLERDGFIKRHNKKVLLR